MVTNDPLRWDSMGWLRWYVLWNPTPAGWIQYFFFKENRGTSLVYVFLSSTYWMVSFHRGNPGTLNQSTSMKRTSMVESSFSIFLQQFTWLMRRPSQGTHATCHAAMAFLPRHCPHGVNLSWQDFTNLNGDIMEYHQHTHIYMLYIYCIILPYEICLFFHIIYIL